MSDPQDPSADAGQHGSADVGNVAEEAAKLFGALSDWARDHGAEVGQGFSDLASHAAASARDVNDHIATDSPECTYCPICRTVHLARQASPEVRAHLASAVTSLVHAAAGMLATSVPTGSPNRNDAGVEHIDLEDDQPWPEGDDA